MEYIHILDHIFLLQINTEYICFLQPAWIWISKFVTKEVSIYFWIYYIQ